MKGRAYKGVTVMPNSKMWELLEKGDTKSADKLLKCVNRMSDAHYEYKIVQEVRKGNPDLY